ncbi:MAG: divergent polysaccharide deacetylase family protein [Alphaproteobacteria bacterium]
MVMLASSKTYAWIRTLIFIIIGAVSIVFADLFIFDRHNNTAPLWWRDAVISPFFSFYQSSNDTGIDVEHLKMRHAQYMARGVDIPKGALMFSDVSNDAAPLATDTLMRIEPAAGSGNSSLSKGGADTILEDFKHVRVGLEPLGIAKEDLESIYSRRSVEDYIVSDGALPQFPIEENLNTPGSIEEEEGGDTQVSFNTDTASTVANDTSLLQDGVGDMLLDDPTPYEVFTHAPIEVDETASPKINMRRDAGEDPRYIVPEAKGKIAVIIDDMGVSLRSRLIEILPGPLTLSYLPYADNIPKHVDRARRNGHEIMVHIPMQPLNDTLDTGPHALNTSQSETELLDALDWGLSQFEGYVGINNHMGSRLTADQKAMDYVMAALKKRGLFFVDSRTISTSVADHSARQAGIPYAVRDIFIDHEVTPEFIAGALKKIEHKALARGYAIAIGHPHKETIEALKVWIPSLKDKGLTLVPVSALLNVPIEQNEHARVD